MSAEKCARIASSVCSDDDLPAPLEVSSKDYALHFTSVLENELSKAPAAQFEIFSVFTSRFLSTHSFPSSFCTCTI